MRILALDVGERRVGVAVSDEAGLTAQPLTTITRQSPDRDLEAVRRLVEEYGATTLVVGLPLTMNGQVGPQAERVRAFAAGLEAVGLPIAFWDERLTTKEAERTLLAADVSRRRRRQVRDKLAATLILEGYLEHLASATRRDLERPE